jgi:hypothetical protein
MKNCFQGFIDTTGQSNGKASKIPLYHRAVHASSADLASVYRRKAEHAQLDRPASNSTNFKVKQYDQRGGKTASRSPSSQPSVSSPQSFGGRRASVGIQCKKKPTLIFLVNPNENRSVIEEARKLDIPIIALTNSDTNLLGITYPIPANDCSLDVLHRCLDWIHRVTIQSN